MNFDRRRELLMDWSASIIRTSVVRTAGQIDFRQLVFNLATVSRGCPQPPLEKFRSLAGNDGDVSRETERTEIS